MRPSKVEHVTTTVSYLRERLTLIFAHEIQASKSSFLKTTAPYKSTFSSLFYKVYRSANHPSLLVMRQSCRIFLLLLLCNLVSATGHI